MAAEKTDINVTMTPESYEELSRLAKEAGMDMSQCVRKAVLLYGMLRDEVKKRNKHIYIGSEEAIEKEILLP